MAWRQSTLLAVRASALAASVGWAGCVDDSVSLRVDCAILPEPDESGCLYNPGGECLLEGRLNVRSASTYQGVIRVVSSLKPRQSDIPVQAETNNITIEEFEVEVLYTSGARVSFGNNLPNPFTIATSGFVPVGGVGVASGTLLPTPYVAQIAQQEVSSEPIGEIILSVRVRGRTQGDVEVETAPWRWPIRLYALDPNGSQCQIFDDGVCNIGQDAFVNACANQGR